MRAPALFLFDRKVKNKIIENIFDKPLEILEHICYNLFVLEHSCEYAAAEVRKCISLST